MKEKNKGKSYSLLFTIITAAAVWANMVANILQIKQVQIGPIEITVGVLVFPILYIVSDVVSEVYGYRASRTNAWIAAAANFSMVVLFQISIMMKGTSYFEYQKEIEIILGDTPRFFIASTVAFVVGDFVNDKVFEKIKQKDKEKKFQLRAIVSSMAGQAVDTCIFMPIAFVGSLPTMTIATMMIWEWAIKIVVELLILPLTTVITKKVKEHENSTNG